MKLYDIGVEHLNNRRHVFLGSNVFVRCKMQNQIIRGFRLQQPFRRGTSVVDRQEPKFSLNERFGSGSEIAYQFDQSVFSDVYHVNCSRIVSQQEFDYCATDASGAACHQDTPICDR